MRSGDTCSSGRWGRTAAASRRSVRVTTADRSFCSTRARQTALAASFARLRPRGPSPRLPVRAGRPVAIASAGGVDLPTHRRRRRAQPRRDRPDRQARGQTPGDLLPLRQPEPTLGSSTPPRPDPTTAQQIRPHRAGAQPQLPRRRLRRPPGPQPYPHLVDRLRRQPLIVAMSHRNLLDSVDQGSVAPTP
jgi:hypothetical protein